MAKFVYVCEAYEVLIDEQKRAEYNTYGKAAFQPKEFFGDHRDRCQDPNRVYGSGRTHTFANGKSTSSVFDETFGPFAKNAGVQGRGGGGAHFQGLMHTTRKNTHRHTHTHTNYTYTHAKTANTVDAYQDKNDTPTPIPTPTHTHTRRIYAQEMHISASQMDQRTREPWTQRRALPRCARKNSQKHFLQWLYIVNVLGRWLRCA